jgi:hypothetical protein
MLAQIAYSAAFGAPTEDKAVTQQQGSHKQFAEPAGQDSDSQSPSLNVQTLDQGEGINHLESIEKF